MRIAHVSDCFLPRTGGIETQVLGLASAQSAAGDDITVITATPGDASTNTDQLPFRLVRVSMNLPAELPVHPRARSRIRDELGFAQPDAVHVHVGVVSPFAWSGISAARDLGLPTVVTIHGVWGPIARRALRRVRGWAADGVLLSAVSDVAAASVRVVSPDSPVTVIPNGIDTASWPPVPWSPEPGSLRVVSVLRLAPRKRAGALVDALVTAADDLAGQVRLTAELIGDGPERARLARRIERAGMAESIRLPGRLSPAGIREVFARSDVFAQASVRESFGLAALEARTSGLPVVARRESGTSSFIHDGVEGILVDDDEGLAAALVHLARDRDLLDRLAARARQHPPEESWPRVVAACADAYRQAAARVRG